MGFNSAFKGLNQARGHYTVWESLAGCVTVSTVPGDGFDLVISRLRHALIREPQLRVRDPAR